MRQVASHRIQSLLDRLVSEQGERGLQVAAYHEGELVVDAWAGIADHRTGKRVDGDTLFPVFSVTKGLAATVIHRLVERKLLSYDVPIAELWPEFGAHGKEHITLRHGLNHTAGLPHMPRETGYAELGDWNRMCAAIADLVPVWPAGSRAEYHAVTYGWIVGGLACRATGRSFSQLVQEEIVKPLGIEGMYLGIPDEVESRVAYLEEHNPVALPDDTQPQSVPGWMQPLHTMMNCPDMQRADVPATNGIMTARAVARHYASLLPGGVDGVELLPPGVVHTATQWQPLSSDTQKYSDWLLGYKQIGEIKPGVPVARFGHAGYGGSVAFADLKRGIAVGLNKNLMNNRDVRELILQELDNMFTPVTK